MKTTLKKGQFIETILVAKLEKDIKTKQEYLLSSIVSLILMGVALFNNKKTQLDWDDFLTDYFTDNDVLTNIPYLSGFSGSHFWLHDETHERVLIVYLQKVIIDTNLD
jgi:hypothetical protein